MRARAVLCLSAQEADCCDGLKAINGRVVCEYRCCDGLEEASFDNGRFASVECLQRQPAAGAAADRGHGDSTIPRRDDTGRT